MNKPIRPLIHMTLVCLALLIGLASCATVNPDSAFLINQLDDKAKARVLVETGVRAWNDIIIDQGQVSRINEVRECFVVALRFNPQNQSAHRWLSTIEDYRNAKLRDTVSDARSMLKNKQRKEDDDYALAVAVHRAALIDPANGEVVKLLNDTSTLRNNLAKLYVNRANNSLAKLSNKSSDQARENTYIDAFQNAVRATTADPREGSASGLRSSLGNQILGIIKKRLETLPKLYESARFTAAKGQIDTAADLNRKTNGEFNAAITDAYYSLYFKWAQYNYLHKDYSQAQNRVALALDYKRVNEAVSLQDRISRQLNQADQSVSFDTNLQNIDRLIAAGDIVPAQRQLTSISAKAKEQANQDQLEQRRKKIRSMLVDLYARGVQFYRSENFGSAIEMMETVTAIEPDYEQASDYLEKARQKKKLLDSF